jgi:hypothetical protein
MGFEDDIKRMREEGKSFSEVLDWLDRQFGYDKHLRRLAANIYYGSEIKHEEAQEIKIYKVVHCPREDSLKLLEECIKCKYFLDHSDKYVKCKWEYQVFFK